MHSFKVKYLAWLGFGSCTNVLPYLTYFLYTGSVPAHLYGKTKFGDNVDDEWFIVSLLLKLSKAFPEICIR